MQGLVARDGLVTSAGAQVGDCVVLTKSAGIEGTSILARAYPRDARKVLGQSASRIAARYHHAPGISVVQEAMLAARGGATAMHDPTEGGIAAGLYELAAASGKKITVDLDSIAVSPLTAKLCAHFGLRALGLIGSGALLVTLPSTALAAVVRALHRRRIPAACIGEVKSGQGIEARTAGKRVRFEWSERDELTKIGC
jgi:hydrogenase maturation factor